MLKQRQPNSCDANALASYYWMKTIRATCKYDDLSTGLLLTINGSRESVSQLAYQSQCSMSQRSNNSKCFVCVTCDRDRRIHVTIWQQRSIPSQAVRRNLDHLVSCILQLRFSRPAVLNHNQKWRTRRLLPLENVSLLVNEQWQSTKQANESSDSDFLFIHCQCLIQRNIYRYQYFYDTVLPY